MKTAAERIQEIFNQDFNVNTANSSFNVCELGEIAKETLSHIFLKEKHSLSCDKVIYNTLNDVRAVMDWIQPALNRIDWIQRLGRENKETGLFIHHKYFIRGVIRILYLVKYSNARKENNCWTCKGRRPFSSPVSFAKEWRKICQTYTEDCEKSGMEWQDAWRWNASRDLKDLRVGL